MPIIRLKGGLGNQMFQYAFGRALSMRRHEQLFLDASIFGNEPKIDTPRHYVLGVYNIQAEMANPVITKPFKTRGSIFMRKVKRRLLRLNDFAYHPSLAHSKALYLEGFWNNEKYFKDIADTIRHEFTLKSNLGPDAEKIASDIIKLKVEGKRKSVSIHVRRGDFISNPYASEQHNILTMDYYHRALAHLTSKISKENLKVYIFSDDIPWVKENLILAGFEVEYVSYKTAKIYDYEEIYLMSLCDHNIIANSSFSWWGAWLNRNPDKIVIAPEKWIRNPYINTNDVCPSSWIRI